MNVKLSLHAIENTITTLHKLKEHIAVTISFIWIYQPVYVNLVHVHDLLPTEKKLWHCGITILHLQHLRMKCNIVQLCINSGKVVTQFYAHCLAYIWALAFISRDHMCVTSYAYQFL